MQRRPLLGELQWDRTSRHDRRDYVARMFDIIAPRYDAFTRLFSYGMDAAWKRRLWRLAGDRQFKNALDLGCGTGDLLEKCLRSSNIVRSVGVDLSLQMAELAKTRTRTLGGEIIVGDLLSLPVASNSIDLVTIGYGLRNAADLETAVAEVYRVLRPGALLLVLDFYRPPSRSWSATFRHYLNASGSILGFLFHRQPAVYQYIGKSITRYVTVAEFENTLQQRGFSFVAREPRLFGGICLHAAVKRC